MSRLPIRARVAAAFAVAMAVVLAGTGLLVYLRLASNLTQTLDENLRLRADDVRLLVERTDGSIGDQDRPSLVERGESFAQLLAPDGRVTDASAGLEHESLLDAAERERALARGQLFLGRSSVPVLDEGVRMLAVPVLSRGRRAVLVVGATSENRAEALADLRNALLVAGPLALLLATAAGYRLAGTGLGAVEAMRRRAAEISASTPGGRLPVPGTRDELERLGHTLNDMLDRLAGALERERAFVADAGHELRTPLALLRAELDFALRYAHGEEELRDAMRRASEETDRLVQLAGDLLLIAASDQGRLALKREPVDAASLFESVRNRFLLRAGEAGRAIETEPAGIALDADRLRLEQALGNLVDNALRHGEGAVGLHAEAIGSGVELSVSDSGPGFPDVFVGQAFERFSRPDGGRGGTGTGLGLAIVEAIARAHGGDAFAGTSPSGRTLVALRLPVRAATGSGEERPPGPGDAAIGEHGSHAAR